MKYNLVTLYLFITTISFSQERVNTSPIKFDEIGVNFDNVSGWTFYNGEWEENKNEIRSTFDFKSFKFRSLTYKGFKYYVFSVLNQEGFYEHPDIQMGFHLRDIYNHFIFTKQQYQDLKKFKKIKSKFDCFDGFYDLKNANKIIDVINGKHVSKWSSYDYNKILDFRLEKTKGENVRFVIPYDNIYGDWKFDEAYFEFSLEDFQNLTSLN